ncbi:hypothetical protein Gotri_001170 [Gossypium trilobum]|uniref:RNase H type-1 domain-containing protein n=1 Tax=Gossypium trilobum TaxID=34281 RepID=A0A7J9FE50_9ROSI|nr:hypothetical protein [Gossypium trilobum]
MANHAAGLMLLCSLAFNSISVRLNEIINVLYSWANQFSSVHRGVSRGDSSSLCAPSFPCMCFYVNTDGVVQKNIGLSAIRGVIRDNMGKWILGYNRFLEKCFVFTAELYGFLDGLTLLQKQGYDRVLIQSDNLEMVKTICDRKLDRSNISLVRRIQQILKHEDKWLVRYTLGENNQVANFLAKLAFVTKEELCLFDNPSLEIQEIIKNYRSRGMLTSNIHM